MKRTAPRNRNGLRSQPRGGGVHRASRGCTMRAGDAPWSTERGMYRVGRGTGDAPCDADSEDALCNRDMRVH